MQYEERTAIGTPEGVVLDYPLAGLGTRFCALAIDLCIQVSILTMVGFVLAFFAGLFQAAGVGEGFLIAGSAVAVFGSIYGYEIGFLTLRSGQTPGKQVMGIRVVRDGGGPVDFKAATIRTLVGLIDGPLSAFLVGSISIVVSPRNQRLGDIAAGTLVIRERSAADPERPAPPPPWVSSSPPPAPPEASALLDLTGLKDADLATVRQFLGRRAQLDPGARAGLAEQIAERVRPLVAGAPDGADAESLLEAVAAAAARRR